MTDSSYKLYGMLMSPYSMKMRAYFRYRRIPFQWINDGRAQKVAETKVETYMVPVVEYPDGTFENDSTPIIDKLEANIAERSTEPENEGDAFLAFLIEDFADEWLLWPFFLNRWRTDADTKHNSDWIVSEVFGDTLDADTFEGMSQFWGERQFIGVEKFCGSPDTYDILDDSLHALLGILERMVPRRRFFFGSRPSRAEIAIYGILSQEIQDLTPSAFMRENYTFTTRWVSIIDELSGCEGEWEALSTDADRLLSSPVAEILKLSGKYHLPLLQANEEARKKGGKNLSFDIDGRTFERRAHDRHMPCLPVLKQRYQALAPESKRALGTLLEVTGCLKYLVTNDSPFDELSGQALIT